MKRRRGMRTGLLAASLTVAAFAASAAPADSPAPPRNDNYIDSLALNEPGKPLNHTDTLKDVRDTSSASTQSDIFKPPSHGGPREVTSCHGVSYGKTIWYDFYPDRNGTVRIRTSGFDNVIALYRFSLKSLKPRSHRCVHTSGFPAEELDASVSRGRAYTIQVGGVNGAGGSLEFLFDFFAAPPHRLPAQATLKARALSTGIELLGLTVSTVRAARVKVSCGGLCHPPSKLGKRTERFPELNGVQMPAGSKLKIYVTAPHAIGAFIQYSVQRGNFSKTTRCLEPGSKKPRTRCH